MKKNLLPQDLKKELLNKLSYLSKADIAVVEKAIGVAEKAHSESKRASGEPFIIHPLYTAIRLTNLMLDKDAIVAAILHDTLEDTPMVFQEIRKQFGGDVANLVESVTKLSSVRIKKSWFPTIKIQKEEIPEYERQVETLRKMLLAMSKDIRVILIKLSDKIHNLETLEYLPIEKRERIAKEALEIFAPIAERLGIAKWQAEIENLAFPMASPEKYKELRELAIPEIKVREKYLKKIQNKLESILKKNNISNEISFRAKQWYSLHKKLKKYDNDITKIYDLVALRVVVDTLEECYAVLGIIHSIWKPLPGRIKDYIALPKPNGYQSLHTTVFCDEGRIVEFQIRTKEMDHSAKFGIASHWVYKTSTSERANKDQLKWIKEFSQNQKYTDLEELGNSFRMDIFGDRIFVFTPVGDVKDLPKDATPVDFAYSVHSDLGDNCAGAIVNGKIASLDTALQNGDIVEIIKRKSAKPKVDWLKFVKSQSARSRIKRYVK